MDWRKSEPIPAEEDALRCRYATKTASLRQPKNTLKYFSSHEAAAQLERSGEKVFCKHSEFETIVRRGFESTTSTATTSIVAQRCNCLNWTTSWLADVDHRDMHCHTIFGNVKPPAESCLHEHPEPLWKCSGSAWYNADPQPHARIAALHKTVWPEVASTSTEAEPRHAIRPMWVASFTTASLAVRPHPRRMALRLSIVFLVARTPSGGITSPPGPGPAPDLAAALLRSPALGVRDR